jgi:hypothetical protein
MKYDLPNKKLLKKYFTNTAFEHVDKMQTFSFAVHKIKEHSFVQYKLGFKKCKGKNVAYKMQGYSFAPYNIGEME